MEVVFRLRAAELADEVVWLGMVVSRSEAAGIHHTLLRGGFESCFYGGIGVMEGDFPVRGWSSNWEHADS